MHSKNGGYYYYYYYWDETESIWYCGHYWPVVPTQDDRWWLLWSNWWNEDWRGKPNYSQKTCSSATLPTTNPTWPDLGSNPGLRVGKAATNRLSYGTAIRMVAKKFWTCAWRYKKLVRPRFRWHEDGRNVLRKLTVKRWRQKANVREQ
jgi:hypothetical protein